jgi:hypothetical protein
MVEVKFVAKVTAITVVLFLVLQMNIGGRKAEDHFTEYLRHGAVVRWIKEATQGAIALSKTGLQELEKNKTIGAFVPKTKRTVNKVVDKVSEEFPDSDNYDDTLNSASQEASVF